MTNAATAAPQAFSSLSAWQQLRRFLNEELKPTPGRLRAALIRVAGVLLAMWFGYASNLPEVSAIVAIAFFASSADRDESKKVALGVPPAVLVIMVVLSLVLHVFGPEPLVKTLAFVVIVFTSLYLLQAAQQGQVFLLAGIFGKVFLELWDAGYPGAITQQLQSYIIIDIAAGGLCALLVSYLFGKPSRDPVREFRGGLAKRFELLARILTQPVPPSKSDVDKLRAETARGQESLDTALEAAAKKNAGVRSQRVLFADLIRMSELLMHEIVLLQVDSVQQYAQSQATLNWSGRRCQALAHMVRSGSLIATTHEPPSIPDAPLARLLLATVKRAEEVATGQASLPAQQKEPKKAFFRPDAFTNPDYLNKAARAFAAAFACYCLISGADWSGIGTAVTTCLITSLTTVEQSRQKQSLRIAGAAVGGVFSFFTLIFILPTGIGLPGLSIVTAIVTFLGGWIFAGGPNLNYAGVQLALCYFLAIFGESKTPTSLTTVRDRIAGIFIGNLAMWLFYDRIRPAWTIDRARNVFADEIEAIARMVSSRQKSASLESSALTISRERESFGKAQAAIFAMSEANTPAFTSWTRRQQRDAPEIRYAEAQLWDLFSLALVDVESDLLHLPSTHGPESSALLAETLHSIATNVRNGTSVASTAHRTQLKRTSLGGELLDRIRVTMQRLFAVDAPSSRSFRGHNATID